MLPLAVINATPKATPTNTKTMNLTPRKPYKKQEDRLLKRLSQYERSRQQLLRGYIVNDRYLATV